MQFGMKPLPMLSHMLWHIVQQIVGSTDTFSRFALRKCSRMLRAVVDNSDIDFRSITAHVVENSTLIVLVVEDRKNGERIKKQIEYNQRPEGCLVKKGNREEVFPNESHISMAVANFSALIRSPKVCIGTLTFTPCYWTPEGTIVSELEKSQFITDIGNLLSRLNHTIMVNQLYIEKYAMSIDQLMHFVLSIKPGHLEKLHIVLERGHGAISQLTATEQWKQAKRLDLKADTYPLEAMGNFVDIYIENPTFSVDDVALIIKYLRHGEKLEYFHSPHATFENYAGVCEYLSPFFDFETDLTKYYEIAVDGDEIRRFAIEIGEHVIRIFESDGDEY